MEPLHTCALAFGVMIFGALCGLLFQYRLPSHHLNEASRDTIKLGAALISTLAALVLSLLINSATGTFRQVSDGLTVASARVILLDELLAAYGGETLEIRRSLRESVANSLDLIHLPPGSAGAPVRMADNARLLAGLVDSVRMLRPSTPLQQSLSLRGIELSQDLLEANWTLHEEGQSSLPVLFLVVLLLWLFLLNVTYGLFAPLNGTVLAILLVCALSVASAIFLIQEMNHPLNGYVKVSGATLESALERIGPLPAAGN